MPTTSTPTDPSRATLSRLGRLKGKLRAVAYLMRVSARFVLHPSDFVALYHRDATVARTTLDVGLLHLERDLSERLHALESRIAQLGRNERTTLTLPQWLGVEFTAGLRGVPIEAVSPTTPPSS
jgi:hypothetical protein